MLKSYFFCSGSGIEKLRYSRYSKVMNEPKEPTPTGPENAKGRQQLIEVPPEIKAWFEGEEFQRFLKRDMERDEWYERQADYKERSSKDPEFALEYARRETKNEEEIARLEETVLAHRRRKEQVALEKQQEERESAIPKNLLTNYDDTLRAIGYIEGEGWIGVQNREGQSASSSLKAIAYAQKDSISHDRPIFTIYGAGGYNRYVVFPDGAVKYSRFHGIGDAERARRLGFGIV